VNSEALTTLDRPVGSLPDVHELSASTVSSELRSKPLLVFSDAATDVIERFVRTMLSHLGSRPQVVILDARTSDLTRQFRVSYGYRNVSTRETTPSEELNDQIEELFKSAREGFFDDSSLDNFSTKLTYIVRRGGDSAIVALAPFVVGKTANTEVAAETLRSLGHIDDAASYNFRLTLILTALQSASSWIRDAATLALGAMDDPAAVPFLRKALDRETNQELRLNMQPILEYLQRRR